MLAPATVFVGAAANASLLAAAGVMVIEVLVSVTRTPDDAVSVNVPVFWIARSL